MANQLLKGLIFILLISLLACYRCEEVEDFHFSSVYLSILDAQTDDNLLQAPLVAIEIYREGEIDSTALDAGMFGIDDWEVEKFTNQSGTVNTDTTFQLDYEIHFTDNNLIPPQLNIDTIIFQYSIMDTDCNVMEISQQTLFYNNEIVYQGDQRFFMTTRI